MARYIDADKLKERLYTISVVADDMYGMGINRGLDRAETEIDMLPTADVVEAKHGEWENMGDNFANCSHCGTIFEALPTMFAFKANNIFCRHCGAKMDGRRDA